MTIRPIAWVHECEKAPKGQAPYTDPNGTWHVTDLERDIRGIWGITFCPWCGEHLEVETRRQIVTCDCCGGTCGIRK